MNSLSRHLRASSISSLIRGCGGINSVSRFSSQSNGFNGGSWEQWARASGGASGEGSRNPPPNPPNFQNFTRSALFREDGGWGSKKGMDSVRGILEEEDGRKRPMGFSSYYRPNVETNADIVHIKLLRNNAFVTVTDSKGKVKCKASSGCLPELKGKRTSKYAAEATAEHIGRKARTMGLKSVVVKVNGFNFFKKKRQAIVAFKEGFNSSRTDQNPIVYIEDTTRLAHNGCRLPRKRRT